MLGEHDLEVGQPVHGAITIVEPHGLVVDFGTHRGLVPTCESAIPVGADLADHFGELDEIEGWIRTIDETTGYIELTLLDPSKQRRRLSSSGARPAVLGRDDVQPGEGVPFWELYMRRRSKRSWSNPWR